MKKWRYNSDTGLVLGMGYLPNGFAENELDPIQENIIQEDIPENCNPPLDEPNTTVIRTGEGEYTTETA